MGPVAILWNRYLRNLLSLSQTLCVNKHHITWQKKKIVTPLIYVLNKIKSLVIKGAFLLFFNKSEMYVAC